MAKEDKTKEPDVEINSSSEENQEEMEEENLKILIRTAENIKETIDKGGEFSLIFVKLITNKNNSDYMEIMSCGRLPEFKKEYVDRKIIELIMKQYEKTEENT